MVHMQEIIRQLTVNAQAIRILLEGMSEEQAQWQPNPETWSLQKVMEHVYNEERIDFRMHLEDMFSHPPKPWQPYRPEAYIDVTDYRQSLKDFLTERETSIAWLQALESPDWDVTTPTPFGPAGEVLVLSAGDVLASWLAHDFLHIRQMNELLYAWNEHQAVPYSVQYAGGW